MLHFRRVAFLLALLTAGISSAESYRKLHEFPDGAYLLSRDISSLGLDTDLYFVRGTQAWKLFSNVSTVRNAIRANQGRHADEPYLQIESPEHETTARGQLAAVWIGTRLAVVNADGAIADITCGLKPENIPDTIVKEIPFGEAGDISLIYFTKMGNSIYRIVSPQAPFNVYKYKTNRKGKTIPTNVTEPDIAFVGGRILFEYSESTWTRFSSSKRFVLSTPEVPSSNRQKVQKQWIAGNAASLSLAIYGQPTTFDLGQILEFRYPSQIFPQTAWPFDYNSVPLKEIIPAGYFNTPPIEITVGKSEPRSKKEKNSAKENVVRPLYDEGIIGSVAQNLERSKSILLVGPAGSGRKELTEEFLRRMRDTHYPILGRRPVKHITATALIADANYIANFERNLRTLILNPAQQHPRPIFVLPAAHELVGLGRYEGNNSDFFDRISPYMDERMGGETPPQFIMTTDPDRLEQIPSDFVAKYFHVLRMADMELDAKLPENLQAQALLQTGLKVSLKGAQAAITLSRRFDPVLAEPGRSMQLLEALATKKQTSPERPNSQAVESEEVTEFSYEHYRVPLPERSNAAANALLDQFLPIMNKHYAGAADLKAMLKELHRIHLFGGSAEDGPLGRVLLSSEPGVGKTSLVHAFSYAARGKPAVEVNMSLYGSAGEATVVAFQKKIQSELAKDPWTVFCFNEIENAHEDVQAALFEVMERPVMRVRAGTGWTVSERVVPITHSYWFFTSNAGARSYADLDKSMRSSDPDAFRSHLEHLRERGDGPSKRILLPLVSRMIDIFYLVGPEIEADFHAILALRVERYLEALSENPGRFQRHYSFPEVQEFGKFWTGERGVFIPGEPVRQHVNQAIRFVSGGVALRNQNDPDPTAECVLKLWDMSMAHQRSISER